MQCLASFWFASPPRQVELPGAGWWRRWREQPVRMDLCNVGGKYLHLSNRASLLRYPAGLYRRIPFYTAIKSGEGEITPRRDSCKLINLRELGPRTDEITGKPSGLVSAALPALPPLATVSLAEKWSQAVGRGVAFSEQQGSCYSPRLS